MGPGVWVTRLGMPQKISANLGADSKVMTIYIWDGQTHRQTDAQTHRQKILEFGIFS